jgi:hypothetical protein
MAVAQWRGNAGRGEAGVLRGMGATKAEVVDVAGPRSNPTRGSCSGSCPGSIPTRHRASDSSFVAPRRSAVRATHVPIPPTLPHAYHVHHDPLSSLSVPVVTKRMGATTLPRCCGTWTREKEREGRRGG